MAYIKSDLFKCALSHNVNFRILSDVTRLNEADPENAGPRFIKQFVDYMNEAGLS